MNLHPPCIVYSQDAALVQRLRGFLGSMVRLQGADRPASLLTACRQFEPALLLVDLCAEDSRRLLPQVLRDHPGLLALAIVPNALEDTEDIERAGVWATLASDAHRKPLQDMVQRAIRHWSLIEENRALRAARASIPERAATPRRDESAEPSTLFHFSRAFRHFDRIETMLEHLMEGVASCARVSRVGIFAADHDGRLYRLKAGLKCLEGTDRIEFPDDDPLPCWMRMHPQLISRPGLTHLDDPSEASFLKQMLDTLGAEVIVPLHSGGRVAGWLFFGRHKTGLPFAESDYEALVGLAEHVSVIFENGMLYEEMRMQKTLAESLFHAMPSGIVAVDNSGNIRWFNETAATILGKSEADLLNRRVDVIGSRLGDRVIQCLRGEPSETVEWDLPGTERRLRLQTRRLEDGRSCLGAMLILHDTTEERRMHEKNERIERAKFWTELAAAISHEVRNPLVAISTFAQLLPERYEDPEFRESFSDLARREIRRVNHLLNQIDIFANQPHPVFRPVDIPSAVHKAIELAQARVLFNGVMVHVDTPADLPSIEADEDALSGGLAHLIANAVEACAGQSGGIVTVSAALDNARAPGIMRLTVQDNGKGIAPDISSKMFSPFCSEKQHGVGLGLPIVKRTVADHNGQLSFETGAKGTVMTLELPVTQEHKGHPAQ